MYERNVLWPSQTVTSLAKLCVREDGILNQSFIYLLRKSIRNLRLVDGIDLNLTP